MVELERTETLVRNHQPRECTDSVARASGSGRHNCPGGLAEIALITRREQVVLRRGAASSDRHDVVDVQDDAGSVARATAVAAAEAVASEDPEAEPGGEGTADCPVPRPCVC